MYYNAICIFLHFLATPSFMSANSSRSDATPAYRGYRLQALYTLARILDSSDPENLTFQPEGAEDLALLDASNRLVEVVQVKAYSANLTLSSLSPSKADSFFYRVNGLLKGRPNLEIKIACFGEIGRELLQATLTDGQERKRISQRLSEYGFFSKQEAEALLDQLQLVSVQEADLQQRVFAVLRNLCTGIDPEPAFEMLNYWLYICAENKSRVTQQNIIDRVNVIGRFLAERATYHQEWFTSIVPIEAYSVEAQAQATLSQEFYRGISARYEHILADVDQPRPGKLREIAQKFQQRSVVIVHGASGQGKTALAYRYLHEFFPDHWRFQVQLIESRQHALSIATALAGQASAIGIAIAVYVDVFPSDVGWVELVKQLSLIKNIQILVTVREEDFRRASISGVELQFSDVELQFERIEAQEIYQSLAETEIPPQFLDFDDAWRRFGSGPLMEFVYLVTQGDSLRERLLQQVRRLQDEVQSQQRSGAELELLRLVSIASAFEARLKVKELVRSLGLAVPQRVFELLEEEYLLRVTDAGALVGGLHPIRSSILADILTDPTFSPWHESANACLPLMYDADIGGFLLYGFSRHSNELESLLQTINSFQPNSWIAISGVIRALLWLGIKNYVDSNRLLVEEAYRFVNHGWTFVLDFDITDAIPGAAESFLSALAPVLRGEQNQQIEALRNRQTDRSQVFLPVVRWLSQLQSFPRPPQGDVGWSSLAEALFWTGRLKINLALANQLATLDFNETVESLTVETLADLALGLFYGYPELYRSWLDNNRERLLTRFREATQTIVWEDDGQTIRSHFALKLYQSSTQSSEQQRQVNPQRLVDESMERLQLFRRLFPDRERYSSNGYGHRIAASIAPYDDTEKNIPIENFPFQWLVSVNSTFRSLAELDFRPNNWEEYAQQVLSLRQTVLHALQQLQAALQPYFRRRTVTQILGNLIPDSRWENCKHCLHNAPLLPRCAFDEWGFASGSNQSSSLESHAALAKHNLAFEKYDAYSTAFHEYIRTLSNFFDQSGRVLIVNPHLRDRTNIRAREVADNNDIGNDARLSIVNLADAVMALPALQAEYRNLLPQFVQNNQLSSLEGEERQVFTEFWRLWYFFAFHPTYQFQNASQECAQRFNNKVREIRNAIRRELQALSFPGLEVGILAEGVLWEDDRTLWLVMDGEDVTEVFSGVENAIAAINRAINRVENTELRHYAIKLTWAYIAIVPRVRRRSLNGTAWRFDSIFFSVEPGSHQFNWWHFVPVPIPSDAYSELSLLTWSAPRLETANKLLALTSELISLLAHMRDFERLPEMDELGSQQAQLYFQDLATPISQVLEAVLDTAAVMVATFDELPQSQRLERPNLIAAMELLVNLHTLLLPTDEPQAEGRIEAHMDFASIIEWADRLQEGQHYSLLLYLAWVSDVLETDLV